MDYFDFEGASARTREYEDALGELPSGSSTFELDPDGLAALSFENLDDDIFGHCPVPDLETQMTDLPVNMAGFGDFPSWIPRISKPNAPCDYCSSRHLECLMLSEEQTSCSSCTALFRDCSFSKAAKARDREATPEYRRIDTLHGVSEDAVTAGGPTGTRALRSSSGSTEEIEPADVSNRKNRGRFSRESVRVLKHWLADHVEDPYPTKEQKDLLKALTGLKRSQISTWLANARRRGKLRPRRSISPGLGPSASRAIDIPPAVSATLSYEDMNPLERWKISPPEHEAASVSAIANAVATAAYPAASRDASSSSNSLVDQQRDSSTGSSFSVFREPSLSSDQSKRSSSTDFSFGSVFSHPSQHSYGSLEAVRRKERRRRRRPAAAAAALTRKTGRSEVRMYQCTFCTDSFKTRYDWQRHEKSLHLSLERWICAPLGGWVMVDGRPTCVYCAGADVSPDHLETHNHQQCQEKDVAERTFYRKDHLRQHLRLTHRCAFGAGMESWKAPPQAVKSRCGFCDKACATWEGRVEHLAAHFREGAQMADWKGDWGFEDHIVELVESAMPPWMIDHERRTPMPFSATRTDTSAHNPYTIVQPSSQQPVQVYDNRIAGGGGGGGGGSQAEGNHPGIQGTIDWQRAVNEVDNQTCFRELERLLSIYARNQVEAHGVPPTDEVLQEAARWIVYMSTDPWNQTEADDPEWLARFRYRYRLNPSSGPGKGEGDSFLFHQATGDAGASSSADGGHETTTTTTTTTTGGTTENEPYAATSQICYLGLERLLSTYARELRETHGQAPTDDMLQDEARRIVYASTDPWNQTAADDPEWLGRFKRRYGLSPVREEREER